LIRPTSAVEAIPATVPFVGPEQLMRESGRSELLRLGANESAFGPSPKAIAAMTAELSRLSWYGDPESLDLRDALAAKHRCSPDQVTIGSGIDDVMGLAVRAFVAPGAAALTTRGTYPTFNYHVVGYGGRLLLAPYRDDGMLDLDAMLDIARRERPAIVYLANPDNPSGTFITRDAMARFFERLPHDSMFLLDEAYADFVEETDLLPPNFEDRIIRMRTFSKAYGMAGARIGYGLASAANVEIFQKIRLHYGINRNAQIGALASLEDQAFRDYVVRETALARDDYYALARELTLGYVDSCTNFVCIDLGTAERASAIMNELLRRGVWIRKPGAAPLDRYVRVSAGTPEMRLEFAEAFRAVLAASPVEAG
jgi:histidinol-phosphate aminotransferase